MANPKALLSILFVFFNLTTFFKVSHANREAAMRCPKDTIKFGVCGNWLGLVHEVVGEPPSEQCCSLVKGLADVEAAVCFCTAIKTGLLGVVKFDAPVALSFLVNACEKKVPEGFVCP